MLPAVAFHDRIDRAGLDAGTAEGAARFMQRLVLCGRDLGRDAAAHEVEHVRALFLADANTASAEHAVVVVDGDEGALVVQFVIEALPAERRLPDAELRGIALQIAVARLGAGHAVERMERQDQVGHELPDLLDLRRSWSGPSCPPWSGSCSP